MRETFVILHCSATGPKVETVADHRTATQRAHALAAEGGQVLILQAIGAVHGSPTAITTAQPAPVVIKAVGLKEMTKEEDED